MDGLITLIGEYQGLVKTVGNAIITLVALGVIALLIVRAINAARKSKMSEIWKPLTAAAVVALIAAVSIFGLTTLVNKIAPNDSVLPRDSQSQIFNGS